MPACRQMSLTGTPASACLRIETIWVSVKRDFFMEPPGWGKHARKFYLWGVCGSGKLTGPRLGEPVPAPAARPMHRQRMPLSNGIGRDLEQVVKLGRGAFPSRSEEHTSELQSLMRISYA